jgi:hypothetical protein
MNKRFKGSRFDERIIGYGKDIIYSGNQVFQINIRTVGEDADTIIQGGDHKNNRPKPAIGTRMIHDFG